VRVVGVYLEDLVPGQKHCRVWVAGQ
jgi:hypothetical protein